MNKIIWKGIDSSTIKGLLISELPPITKPKMRVQETEVDGVDGSIIEELGYESYDKSIRIGLYDKFDIDEVIKYFTGEGQVVFSNEPDKYYNAKIIDQIDYERLLRFRTATIKFRVQPFKYKYQEDYELTDKEIEGVTCKIKGEKLTKLSIEGNSEQETRSGRNIFNKSVTPTYTSLAKVTELDTGIRVEVNTKEKGTISVAKYILLNHKDYIGKTIRMKCDLLNNSSGNVMFCIGYIDKLGTTSFSIASSATSDSISFQVTERTGSATYIGVFFYANYDDGTLNEGDYVDFTNVIITVDDDNMTYEDYGLMPSPNSYSEIKNVGTYNENTNKYEIDVTNGINTITMQLDEPLRSLPNGVKDIAYIKNNKLYVDRYVGSVILNGSEEWLLDGNIDNLYRYKIKNSFLAGSIENSGMSNYFKYEVNNQGTEPHFYLNNDGSHFFFINMSTLEQFITWLSENNVVVIYELAEPITENIGELTMFDLIEGENNISNSENANMIVNYIQDKIIANNTGNHIAKPIIEIKGTGTIEFLVNGIEVFNYTFPKDETEVIIDSVKQDAYLGTVLKNRNMIGEFPVFEIGENTITWNGSIESIKISKQSRWL